jgi:cytochrome c oxidase assembly protein subunit 15
MGIFILTGFEGWLGAKVVESHLSPMVITLHMLFALIIVSLQVFTLMRISNKNIELTESETSYAETIPFYLQCLWAITIIEILLGTHMREGLELLVLSFPQSSTDFLMSTLGTFKYVHTGLGIVLVSLTALLWNKIMVHSSPSSVIIVLMRFLIGLFIFQVGMGELMVFSEFSPSFRLLHMWGASISIAIIMAMYMRINMVSKKSNV